MIFFNELIFITYLIVIIASLLTALKLGIEALCALICLQWVLANLFVVKSITLFGFEATASDALAVGAILGLNLIQEYFGKAQARKSIVINVMGITFYTLLSLLHITYMPSPTDIMHSHFCTLLIPMPRILCASLVVYLLVQYIDYVLYAVLKRMFKNRFFIARNYISVACTQLIDTVLFSFLALYGSVHNIGHIIIVSYVIKLITLGLSMPFLAFSRILLAKSSKEMHV